MFRNSKKLRACTPNTMVRVSGVRAGAALCTSFAYGADRRIKNNPTEKMNYIVKKRLRFMMVKEASEEKLNSPKKVYEFMRGEAEIDRECIWVLHMNTKLKLIEKELVSMGTIDTALVHPREVFKKAILNGSSSIIVVHNHPSGDPRPTEEDKKVAKTLKQSGEILGIPVKDFLVISSKGYTSFADDMLGEW